jgi:hypothetical protein
LIFKDFTGGLIFHLDGHQAGLGIFKELSSLTLDEGYPLIRLYLGEEILEFTQGSDIDEKDRGLCVRVLFEEIGGLFERCQATDPRAIGQVILVPRSCALDEGDSFGLTSIRWPCDFTGGWAGDSRPAILRIG